MAIDPQLDAEVRASAMAWIEQRARVDGGVISGTDLRTFAFRDRGLPLVVQSGIWKPAFMDAALSIRTKFEPDPTKRPYDDHPGPDGFMRYKWRGTDGGHSDNRALRRAMELGLPLIYFVGVERGVYRPIFPVYLVEEEPGLHQFVVAFGEDDRQLWRSGGGSEDLRRYAERTRRERLHQPVFRSQVLLAYNSRCALCRLGHRELLGAAHIIGDAESGQPVVTNGIAMCKLHHAAFDHRIVGIDPDYRIHVQPEILEEVDGPTLRHSIQGIDGELIGLPRARRSRPDRDLLAARFEVFQRG